ncbi:MAG: hypothetical protein EHM40_11965 [Chloroflexi bacterium]|nr:MAG: hypothetical protein EHM40_11965 [Chloroflexota bacterium]
MEKYMNQNRENIDVWIQFVYSEWLNRWEPASLRPSINKLIDKMKNTVGNPRKFDDAWKLIEEIEKLQELLRDETRSYSKESPQMLLECGIAAHQMGNSREAIRFLRGAINIYTDAHEKAVARWLLGCVYWHLNDEVNALSCWEISLNDFKELENRTSKNLEQATWYRKQAKKLSEIIRQAAEINGPPPIPLESRAAQSKKMHLIRSLPVIGEIPAGTPLNVLPAPVDFMETDQVLLGDKKFRIVSLFSGEKVVILPVAQRFFILRVNGTSMNRTTPEPIEDGDYVIMREQRAAEHRDIVAAEIVSGGGKNDRATLKRFMRQDGKIYLVPESDDPRFSERIDPLDYFTKFDEGFYIRGVAVAVLKPLPK